ncbi:hypothetical protein FJQ54_13045 [Sandaracinobacter neustonicus]|uniref:Uncharacterized protein n=1 Tax=Sandaracinobacter neustonicus TaxID=1715348 RepID=A0A501XGH5_9SPHN|nr:hypothetical protein [Sandaracinobacter neustonicus]TPE59417.1 hypothetical protein FJQ54_13045 [Sandaracinobacter neustonicus]
MVTNDRSEIAHLIRDLRSEAASYNRQWHVWLGLASGGGAVAILSFAANLPDPDFALRRLLPTLVAFTSGIVFSGFALFAASRRISSLEGHHAAAFTRGELDDAIKKIPIMMSAPASLAYEHNAARNRLTKEREQSHQEAEAEWKFHLKWKAASRLFIGLAVVGFVAGLVLPLVHIGTGGNFAPPPSGEVATGDSPSPRTPTKKVQ